MIKRYFGEHPSYLYLLNLFLDTKMRTELGQLLDLLTAPPNAIQCNLDKFSDEIYQKIVRFKTAYYSFTLPVFASLIAMGRTDLPSDLEMLERALIELGEFFQIQDDYLDCYGDPKIMGKVGTDIQEGKCSWLVVTALKSPKLDSAKHAILTENYGKHSKESEDAIKSLYRDLELESEFHQLELATEGRINSLIAELNSNNPALGSIARMFANRIVRRNK